MTAVFWRHQNESYVFSPEQRGWGRESASLSILPLSSCASGPLEHVHLALPFVTTKNKEVNATAVLWPSQVGTLTYVWWYGNNTEVGHAGKKHAWGLVAAQFQWAEAERK